jgi:hypothetical protein
VHMMLCQDAYFFRFPWQRTGICTSINIRQTRNRKSDIFPKGNAAVASSRPPHLQLATAPPLLLPLGAPPILHAHDAIEIKDSRSMPPCWTAMVCAWPVVCGGVCCEQRRRLLRGASMSATNDVAVCCVWRRRLLQGSGVVCYKGRRRLLQGVAGYATYVAGVCYVWRRRGRYKERQRQLKQRPCLLGMLPAAATKGGGCCYNRRQCLLQIGAMPCCKVAGEVRGGATQAGGDATGPDDRATCEAQLCFRCGRRCCRRARRCSDTAKVLHRGNGARSRARHHPSCCMVVREDRERREIFLRWGVLFREREALTEIRR